MRLEPNKFPDVTRNFTRQAERGESIVNCAHITRTRYAHKVTAASLLIVQKQAYRKYVESVKEREEADSFSTWRSKKEITIPQFETNFALLSTTLGNSQKWNSVTLGQNKALGALVTKILVLARSGNP